MADRCGKALRRGGSCGRPAGHNGQHLQDPIGGSLRYRERHPERTRASRIRHYRTTSARVDAARTMLIERQGGLCPCGDPLDADVVVDHDHACCSTLAIHACGSCYRAAMHRKCNTAIGLLGDDHEKIARMARYLQEAKVG